MNATVFFNIYTTGLQKKKNKKVAVLRYSNNSNFVPLNYVFNKNIYYRQIIY